MTRRLPTYSPDRIRDVVTMQREVNPGCHDQLIAGYAAMVLTGGCGDDEALANASRQALEWMALAHVEGGV